MPVAYLSLGSNLGNREGNLRAALDLLGHRLTIRAVSSTYETDPVGVTEQSAFLNAVAEVETDLEPEDLLRAVKDVEAAVGRRPTFHWGPRVVDVDIVLYGDRAVELPHLTIPHREMVRRAFVLVPLAEIAPDAIHPVSGLSVRELCRQAPDLAGVRLYQSPNRSSAHGSPSM